ncbi:MAG TPA: 50S ribosomal protein L25 [Candidatus Anammoximicrobium sp.]|nr:50S ribosomal protein L25 [Candidatus Anammoximicrobium sp.]
MRAVLNASVRTEVGSNGVKKVRKAGRVPAVLYGHGEQNVNLSLCAEELHSVLRHGARLVDLKGDVTDTALVRDLQWNTYGTDVLHVDLARVSAEERVHVSVPLETRGTAIGAHEGGIVELVMHEIEIECPAGSIPDKIEVRVHEMHVGNSLKAGEIPLPEGSRLLADPDIIVVHCVGRVLEEEEVAAEAAAEAAEPEVIGRKGKAEEEEEES